MEIQITTEQVLKHFPNSKIVFKGVQKLTAEEIANDDVRLYNESVWKKTIKDYSANGDCQFYKVPKGTNGYDYDKFYAIYTADGIRFLNDISYSVGLTNAGFTRVLISTDMDIITSLFSDGETTGRLGNDSKSREWLRKQSDIMTVTNSL